MTDIGLLTAFVGGLLSFLSPCVLPLAPPYLAWMAGTTLDQVAGPKHEIDRAAARRVAVSSLFFVAGLATVFVTLGATATLAGQTLAAWRYEFGIVAGFVIYLLGQHFIGFRRALVTYGIVLAVLALFALTGPGPTLETVLRHAPVLGALGLLASALWLSGWDHIPVLMREARFSGVGRAGSYGGAYVIGLAFAFGWTPCIGPILGSILFLAAQEEHVRAGVWMLFVYSMGLGLPFVLAALFVRPFLRAMRRFRNHMGTVEIAMGGLLVGVGALMMTGSFEVLAFWLLETFPALGRIG